MIELLLTQQEAIALRNLLDVAVKAAGMQAAEVALAIDRKIIAAGQDFLDKKNTGAAEAA